ncbi:MAG: hypothetical protein Tsb0034_08100 [Ekhidna sp.]
MRGIIPYANEPNQQSQVEIDNENESTGPRMNIRPDISQTNCKNESQNDVQSKKDDNRIEEEILLVHHPHLLQIQVYADR